VKRAPRAGTGPDVAIVGGGIAGTLLARQLRMRMPGLRITVFERGAGGGAFKVGESTVEIAAHYLVRRQKLAQYLYENHLPKNGIRYFFDGPKRDVPLTEMSEIGTINLPFHAAFQLDRARLEADLIDMCRGEGIDVRIGARVTDIALGEGRKRHELSVETPAGSERVRARWVIDAAGRQGTLARQLGLREAEPHHLIGSVWGRFEGLADVDRLGDESFHGRVRHTTRGLSTIHFLNPGYWVWLIRLRGGVTSVGVVGMPARDRALRTSAGFRAFLDEHRALREILADSKAIDHGSFARIAYGTKRFLGHGRWALVGEGASATDPLYSPGLDFVALECDFITDIVARDAEGEPADELAKRIDLYDRFLEFRHQAVMRLYRGLYGMIGSYELMRLKWDFDIASYHNLWVAPFMTDKHLDADWLRRQLRLRNLVLRAMENFADLFGRAEEMLRADGNYYRRNRGVFSYGLENIDFLPQIGLPRSQKETLEQAERTFNVVRRDGLALLGRDSGPDWPLRSFVTQSLV
jgi:flavin-dependent dehydrogenase